MNMTGIIDYGAGNLKSLCNTLDAIGSDWKLIRHPDELDGITAIIFPGVGAFGDCARHLSNQELINPLREWIQKDLPFLGICIGFQMLFEGSDESPGSCGLGVLSGQVVGFPDIQGMKVPHMGWNHLALKDTGDPAWNGLGSSPYFYFVHSFFPQPLDESIIASTTAYGQPFASSVRRGRLLATQFHPEKSQGAGSRLIRNFLAEVN
jgi:imidazole glycerol phosphate synthase glutamine amidotransferase subunit